MAEAIHEEEDKIYTGWGLLNGWQDHENPPYAAMKGEDEDDDSEGSFQSASVWKRMLVVLAGPIFNFIPAFAASIIIISIIDKFV